jgi:hypothetical protein
MEVILIAHSNIRKLSFCLRYMKMKNLKYFMSSNVVIYCCKYKQECFDLIL